MRIFGIRSCDTCRQATKWLDRHGIEYQYVDIRGDELSVDVITRWQARADWEELINKRSITWRRIPAVDREDLDADSARYLILAYPTVVRRPVLELPDGLLLGFDEATYAEALGPS